MTALFTLHSFAKNWKSVSYLTLKSQTSDMQVKETGLHFSRFQFEKAQSSNEASITNIETKDLDDTPGLCVDVAL